jgi:Holliday junction resolvase RusA-like endonuclease
MIAQFSIPGPPVAKGRPKFARRGGFVTTYTPEKTVNFEGLVKSRAAEAMDGEPPAEGPVRLSVMVMLPIPASWSGKKQTAAASGNLRPTSKPDWDNFGKIASDGMNGIVYRDDSQIVSATVEKHYSINPRVDVLVMAA